MIEEEPERVRKLQMAEKFAEMDLGIVEKHTDPFVEATPEVMEEWAKIKAEEKKKLVEAFFQEGIGGQAEREIDRLYRPAYLFYGPRERELGKLEHEIPTIVYQNESVTIMDLLASPYNSRSGSGGNE